MRSRPAGSRPATTRESRPAPPRSAARPASRPSVFPPLAEILDPRGPFLIPLALLLVTRVAFWVLIPLANEDAYITFRYARNLVTGSGLVYNPGERVMGFSSPLWAVWNAAGYALTRDPLTWSRITSVIADLVTLVLMGSMLQRGASRAAAWCFTFFFAAWPYFGAVATSGMEMSAFVALIVLAAALIESRSIAAGPLLATVVLARPEGVAAALILALGANWRDRAIAAGLIAVALATLAATYGSVVPQSLISKSRIYGTPGPLQGRMWWDWLSPFAFGGWTRLGETGHLMVMNVVLAPAFVVGAVELWRRRAFALARTLAAPLSIWIGYSMVGVPYFWWYLLTPLVGIAALAAVGFPTLIRGRAVPIAVILFVLGVWTIVPRLYTARAATESLSFAHAADVLARNGRAGEKVLLEPIGIVGWRTPLTVIDEIGLVSPRVAERRVKGAGWYTDVVHLTRPEWLVARAAMLKSGEAFAGAGMPFRNQAERDTLLAGYTLVDAGPQAFGDQALTILRRRP